MRPTVGKFCTPLKPESDELVEEHRHQAKWIGAADSGEHGGLLHDREHLARHVDDDRVRIAVRKQPGE